MNFSNESGLAGHGLTDPLDIEQPAALLAYLRHSGRIQPDEQPTIRILAGGVSNRTVWVERANGPAWVLKQALPKLRVAVDWFSRPERIQREALGLRWLAQLAPAGTICPLLFEDHRQHLLAMEAVPQPHDNWKSLLLAGRLDMTHIDQFGRLLGTIHRQAFEQRAKVAPVFADRSFFESLRLEPYYAYPASQLPAAADFLHGLIEESRANCVTLVHGDYSPKNILVYQNRLILLDHEVIHWGDPAFDLGFSLTHLLSKAHHLSQYRHNFAVAAQRYWQVYHESISATHVKRDDRRLTSDHQRAFSLSLSSNMDYPAPFATDMAAIEARAVRHTLACLLARVDGRSPLEYLDEAARSRQRQAVLALLPAPPDAIPALVEQFIAKL